MLRQKFTVQVTTLPGCDDITRFDGTVPYHKRYPTYNKNLQGRPVPIDP
jgi:hypothetical protein